MLLSDYLKKPERTPAGTEIENPVTPSSAVMPKSSAQEVKESNSQTATDAYNGITDRLNQGEDVFKVLLDSKYNTNKQDIERQRKAALLGDIANLFGQTVSSAQGARRLAPIQSKVPYYNEQLQRLKDWRKDADINYSLSQARNDMEMKKHQQKLALDKYKMDIQQGQFGEKMKLSYAKLAEDVRKNRITQEQADKRLKELMRHNKVSEGTASYNAQSSRISAQAAQERAKKSRSGGTNSNESIVVSDSNGNIIPVIYSEEKRGAVISLLGRMKKIITDRASKMSKNEKENYLANLDDINLSLDTPDQAGRALTVLQTRLQDFPELTDEFYKIIGKDNGSNNVAPWRNTSNNHTTTAPWRK